MKWNRVEIEAVESGSQEESDDGGDIVSRYFRRDVRVKRRSNDDDK